ncbi:unnamed protein product [Linum trigynum]|uniref:RING-type E3 ubiquitin transferase n=1 Tax=Linum trigynum TaxID=586398 RepID=A0AAV2FKQ1_9ROSI
MDDSPQSDYYATATDLAASQPSGTTPSSPTSSIVTPLLISFAGVTLTLLVLLAYHFLIVKFCLRRQGAGGCGKKGVDGRVLNAIPILSYSKEDEKNNNVAATATASDDCVICIVELEEGATVRFLPSCGHVFHAACVDHWFSAHSSFPTCRAPVVLPPPALSGRRDDVMKPRDTRNTAAGGCDSH